MLFPGTTPKPQKRGVPILDNFCFDVSTGLNIGQRDRQEDAVVSDFALGAAFGFGVLSDGMGGHASGNIASGIVVTEVFSELKMQCDDPKVLERDISDVLRSAVAGANHCMHLYESRNPETRGMGATLVAPVLFGNRLYWISVGDSPLYLYRAGKLFRLNEDHSFAAKIDALEAQGVIALEEAMNHPDRNCLVSVLSGADIAEIDCRSDPLTLHDGDIVLAASDGVHTLSDGDIVDVLHVNADKSSNQIANAIMTSVKKANCPDQDNLSLCLIKVERLHKQSQTKNQPQSDDAASNDAGTAGSELETAQVVKIDRTAKNSTIHTVFSLSRKVRTR